MKHEDKKLEWYTAEQVFKKVAKKKEFQRAYSEEMARISLAEKIKELRNANSLTQKMVADRTGMPQSVIARIESGDRGISVDTLSKIAYAFGKKIALV